MTKHAKQTFLQISVAAILLQLGNIAYFPAAVLSVCNDLGVPMFVQP
jgi:hypothetical protein